LPQGKEGNLKLLLALVISGEIQSDSKILKNHQANLISTIGQVQHPRKNFMKTWFIIIGTGFGIMGMVTLAIREFIKWISQDG
jgi:hypothetical protein